jgi:hypothetical protein
MAQYMLLFYQLEAERERRRDLVPEWDQLAESLRATGQLVAGNALRSTETATTVRVRGGEAEITDGPFAVTKEMLGGYMVIDCADIDEALRIAERVPVARYGSVEVRPVMDAAERAVHIHE